MRRNHEMWSLTSLQGFRFFQCLRVSKEKPLWYNFLLNWLNLRENQCCSDELKSIQKNKQKKKPVPAAWQNDVSEVNYRNEITSNNFLLQSLSIPAQFKAGPTVIFHPRKWGSMQQLKKKAIWDKRVCLQHEGTEVINGMEEWEHSPGKTKDCHQVRQLPHRLLCYTVEHTS